MTTSCIDIDRRGDVMWITLNRPERLNAITPTLARELADTFTDLSAEGETARVVVLRGAGRAFCAGLDIHAFLEGGSSGEPDVGVSLGRTMLAMRRCPQPIIALVHGAACGGGFSLALASDVRLAGESAKMNDAYVTLGLSGCELGMSYFLPRLVGRSVAAELMMTGDFIHAERAERVGLVSRVMADGELEQAGAELAERMMRTTRDGLRLTKSTLDSAAELHDLAEVIEIETKVQLSCMAGPGFQEALQAFGARR